MELQPEDIWTEAQSTFYDRYFSAIEIQRFARGFLARQARILVHIAAYLEVRRHIRYLNGGR